MLPHRAQLIAQRELPLERLHRSRSQSDRLLGGLADLALLVFVTSCVFGGWFLLLSSFVIGVTLESAGSWAGLLQHMSQLMRQESSPLVRPRSVSARTKYDVMPQGVCARVQRLTGFGSARVGMNADASEIRGPCPGHRSCSCNPRGSVVCLSFVLIVRRPDHGVPGSALR